LRRVDFGWIPTVEGVSFALAPLPERSRRLLAAHAGDPGGPDWLRAGAPAWGRKDWLGRLYPRGTPDRDLLRVYAQRLGAIEFNASYYHVPTEAMLDAWAAEVPEAFHFCPKLHQSITHGPALAESIPEARDFAQRFLRLGPRLGPAFLQLPPWLGPEALPALDALLAAFPDEFRVTVEFRHPAWFSKRSLREDAVTVLERRGAGTVITDVAGRRDVSHAALTAPFVIVRWVGNSLDPTDLPRADVWLERLLEWRGLGLRHAYFFAHQPDDAFAPEILSHFVGRARERGIDLPAVTLEPRQLDLFGGAAPAPPRAALKSAKPTRPAASRR
jgi:uncharacterized protein YecE (DUF72 family)